MGKQKKRTPPDPWPVFFVTMFIIAAIFLGGMLK